MAIAFDRSTAAVAEATDPTRRHLTDGDRHRLRFWTLATSPAAIVVVPEAPRRGGVYPDEFETSTTVYKATIDDWVLARIQSALDYVQDPASFVFGITEPVGNFLVQYGLEPLRVSSSRPRGSSIIVGAIAIALVLSGPRPAARRC